MVSFIDQLFFPERKSLHQRLCTEITTKLNKDVATAVFASRNLPFPLPIPLKRS